MGSPSSGRGGLSRETVEEAVRLLALGRSTAAVARELEISARTVRHIRRGEHFRQRRGEIGAVAPYARCRCGALTREQPCLACRLRRPERPWPSRRPAPPDEPPGRAAGRW